MIARYSRDKISAIWSEKNKLDLWLKIELLVCEAWADEGRIPKEALEIIKKKAAYDPKRVVELEKDLKHDVIAFLTSVAEFVGRESRYVHLGLTSSDLLDTAFSFQLTQASQIINDDIKRILGVLKKQAGKYKKTPMMGRTHGIHAEPITFGLKLALWYQEFERQLKRFEMATEDIRVGKISGAVGTYAHLSPGIESYVCEKLGLVPDEISNQIIQRDRHASYFSTLAGIASSIEKVATEIRHLQRTEVFEVAEPFGGGQKGSSAMPHKRNPILCENISGLARVVRSNALAAFENMALWHERDISHSSVERIIAPDSTTLVDFMLSRLADILEGMDVFEDRMKSNIELTGGLYASQDLMLGLVDSGMSREEAYKIVQDLSMRTLNNGEDFKKLVMNAPAILRSIDKSRIEAIFDLNKHLSYVDEIFNRVFS